jgi:hypothetical protein
MDERTQSTLDNSPLTPCQTRLKDVVGDFRQSVLAMHRSAGLSDAEVRSLSADICLTSRSALSAYNAWLVIHGTYDEPAENVLEALFQDALKAMPLGNFRESVELRHREFKSKCKRIRGGKAALAAPSSVYDDSL